MKKLIFVFLIACTFNACTSTAPSSGTSLSNEQSPESQAKILTDKMTSALSLTAEQKDKVLMINVVNAKIMKRLRESNESSKISGTQEKYKSEIKEVLTQPQYNKFLTDF